MDQQTTLKKRVSLSGVGVHSGKPVTVHFNPATAGEGIVFKRIDSGAEGRLIRAHASQVAKTDLCTVIGNNDGDQVMTIEHLMSAVSGLGIDNLLIEIDNSEVPILDGSSIMFVDAFVEAGIETLPASRRFIRILKPVRVEAAEAWAELVPYNGTRFEVEIDFATPAIGLQKIGLDLSARIYSREISHARTFGFIKDVEWLWAAGLALGSSLENSVVIGEDDRVVNAAGLRYPDEFVRHKTLDAIGDLAVIGGPIIGCFRSYRSGHRLNGTVVKEVLADPSAFEIVEARRAGTGYEDITRAE